jgi:hypothetical protein
MERASVRGEPRNRTRVATVESSEVSLAWAHQGIRVERAKWGVGWTTTTAEVTTTTRGWW